MKLSLSRLLPSAGAIVFTGLALFSWPGCGTECAGGVLVDGVCEGRCDPSACLEGNVCVGNRCMLVCDSHTDCYNAAAGQPRYQACMAQKTDVVPAEDDPNAGLNEGPEAYVCTDIDKAPNIGLFCPFGTECDASFACPDGTPCEQGKDSEGHCTAAECKPLKCITTGEADAEAYCTTVDCKTDDDCGPGFYCGIRRDPQKICGTMKGDEDPCIDPANFGANGATYQEGPVSLLRNVCLKREPCAPCKGPFDCSLSGDMACVSINGEQVCAKTCVGDEDCPDDFKCAGGYCIPRTETCKPPATGNFCFNCLNDLDCGPAGPDNTVYCAELSGGQHGCFDSSFPDDCTADTDCPTSPSGKYGECLDEGEGVTSADSVYHRCYLPYFPTPSKFQCWAP